MPLTPTAGYSLILRLEIQNLVGMFGKLTSAIGDAGGSIGAIDLINATKGAVIRDITVHVFDQAHAKRVVDSVKAVPGVKIVNVSDRTFLMHLGGKIEIASKIPVKNRDDLSNVYTPGVARVCLAIHDDPSKAFQLTMKRNMVAVVTDGTAVLGLGDIGPAAALPVMEGKAMLFKQFANVDAFPICLDTKETKEIIQAVKWLAPSFGGINLEDIASPRCFEIEEALKAELDIPVFHDDQHGTAVVALAGLLNSLKITGKRLPELKVIVCGVGAAGVAIMKILLAAGVSNVIGVDRDGAIFKGGGDYSANPMWAWSAQNTNPDRLRGSLSDVIRGADVFIGVSRPGVLKGDDVRKMAKDPIVFAMANPTPEVDPDEAASLVRVLATGRSDYPNQINNVLCFPGIFRGALDCRARQINEAMKLAAANAIASVVGEDELHEEYIIPSVFNRRVADVVAAAVMEAAYSSGVARRERRDSRGAPQELMAGGMD